jgi:hypothetical protein
MKTLFKGSFVASNREGFFYDLFIRDLKEAHHDQEKESIEKEEFTNEELSYLEHASNKSLEDHTSPRNEPEEEAYKVGYQSLEEEQESPNDSIEDNKHLIEEREPEGVDHENDHQMHQVEHELPCEYTKKHLDETHHVEDSTHV